MKDIKLIILLLLCFLGTAGFPLHAQDCFSESEMALTVCGDGHCGPGEGCPDDCGETVCGDGRCDAAEDCADDCGSACEAVCGDSICSVGEDCPDDCAAAACGDAICGQDEICADECAAAVCGDGAVETGEACDDGNTDAEDGCAVDCGIEAGYSCSGEPSVCSPDCVPSAELCDDAADNDCDGMMDCADPECDGQACGQGDGCVGEPVCDQGQCVAGQPISCDDGDDCTADGCDMETGCIHVEVDGCQPNGEEPGEDSGSGGNFPIGPSLAGGGFGCAMAADPPRANHGWILAAATLIGLTFRISRRRPAVFPRSAESSK